MRAARHDRHRRAQNADHLAHNSPFSPVFAEVVCTVGTTPPHVGTSPPPNGGNGVIRTTTRRRHADNQRLMLQNPHRHRYGRRRAADKTWAQRRVSRKNPPNTGLPAALREIVRPARPLQRHYREKTRPASPKTPKLECFECAGRTISRLHNETPPQGELIRTRTHTRPSRAKNFAHRTNKHGDAETNNTTARPPNKAPLKPASPLRPKTAPKTPISHPQRLRRFQPHTDTSKQRRARFQTTGPPRLQHTRTVPGGREGPGCGARGRQGLAGLRADAEHPQHTRRRRCGGRRRDRRARLRRPWAAGPSRTVSRQSEPHVSTTGVAGVKGAGGTGGHGRASRRGAERSEDA